jgi:hypothetical protein
LVRQLIIVDIIAKAGDCSFKFQLHLAGRAVALLGDDQFGHAFHALEFGQPFGMIVKHLGVIAFHRPLGLARHHIIFLAEHEQHNVRVLLDRARFAKVRELRALVFSAFDSAAELRERDDGDVKFLR